MGGTIFLDEIGEMPLDLQAKLLRVVEQKQLMRLGGSRLITVDVKIIAATNADIWEMIEKKQFRADLFYRLSTMRLNLMPLRERKGDIIPLCEYFIRRISKRIGKDNIMRLTDESKALLLSMDWLGNIRELQNLIECIVQLYPGGSDFTSVHSGKYHELPEAHSPGNAGCFPRCAGAGTAARAAVAQAGSRHQRGTGERVGGVWSKPHQGRQISGNIQKNDLPEAGRIRIVE